MQIGNHTAGTADSVPSIPPRSIYTRKNVFNIHVHVTVGLHVQWPLRKAATHKI